MYKDESIRQLVRSFIITYSESTFNESRIEKMIDQFCKYDDICMEICNLMNSRAFDGCQTVCIEGYTAMKLKKNFSLNMIGAYNYLIYLREDAESALNDLKNGLPRK